MQTDEETTTEETTTTPADKVEEITPKEVTKDLDYILSMAVYEHRTRMDSGDWLEIEAAAFHPLGWWLRQPTQTKEFYQTQIAIRNCLNKAGELLQQGTLTPLERTELEGLLRMLGTWQGPIKKIDHVRYFTHLYFPWAMFAKNLFYGHPYWVFSISWALIFLSAFMTSIYHDAVPILLTFALPLIATLALALSVLYIDRNPKFHPTTRFWAIMPLTLVLCLSFAGISVIGQLPIGIKEQPQLIVSRDGITRGVITVNTGRVRYPNLWETLLRGDTLQAMPEFSQLENTFRYDIPSLKGGSVGVTITTVLRRTPQEMVGSNYNLLAGERAELRERAKAMMQKWASEYNPERPNPSLLSALNELTSPHFGIKATSGTITWLKETEVLKEETVTQTIEKKVTVPKKIIERPQIPVP
jgi:hypothetical protein